MPACQCVICVVNSHGDFGSELMSSSASGSLSSGRSSEQLSWTSRLQQKALRAREDRLHYKRWLTALRSRHEFQRAVRRGSLHSSEPPPYPLVYIFGRYYCIVMSTAVVLLILVA
jgi:hypothetical protein